MKHGIAYSLCQVLSLLRRREKYKQRIHTDYTDLLNFYIICCFKQADMINNSVNTPDNVCLYINTAYYKTSWLILNQTFDITDMEISLTTRTGPCSSHDSNITVVSQSKAVLTASIILSRGCHSYNIKWWMIIITIAMISWSYEFQHQEMAC